MDPVLALLRQGTSPEELARTFALGTVCSLFRFLGTTSLLNLLAGRWHKMNEPVLQTLNQVFGPLQLSSQARRFPRNRAREFGERNVGH